MRLHPFIFNWRGQYEKTKEKESQFLHLGYDNVTVINSDDNHREDKWHNIGEESYFTKQFLTAVNFLDGDILFHIQGDASYDKWKEVISAAEDAYNCWQWGIFAPNVDWTEWNRYRADVRLISLGMAGKMLVSCPDCTCWMIHKKVIQKYNDLHLDMSDQNLGFGIDILMSALSHTNKWPVIRDYNHTIDHPRGTNYSVDKAHTELESLMNKLPPEILTTCMDIYRRPEKIADLY
jgi:hypothetical protein